MGYAKREDSTNAGMGCAKPRQKMQCVRGEREEEPGRCGRRGGWRGSLRRAHEASLGGRRL
eukprot:621572-Rhodomonas_salina.2